MKKRFIAALLFGSLLSEKGWGMEDTLRDAYAENPTKIRAIMQRFGLDAVGAVNSLGEGDQFSFFSALFEEPDAPIASAPLSASGSGSGTGAVMDSFKDDRSAATSPKALLDSYQNIIRQKWFEGDQERVLKAFQALPELDGSLALEEINWTFLWDTVRQRPESQQRQFLKNIGIDISAASKKADDLEASLELARQLEAEEQKARSGAFYASAYGAASAEGLVEEASRTAPKTIMSPGDLKSLEEAVRVHEATSQDTDVHAFNGRFSGPVVQGINGLATRVITEKGLDLPSLKELVGLTDNSEAKTILVGANINGHDSESGAVSLHAATEVQEAYALAEFVDRWEHAGIHRFEDSSGVQVAGNLVGLLFHKLGENVATGGGCTAGIRGRATEVKLICLNILRDKGFFTVG